MGVELSDISGTGGRVGFGRYIGENTSREGLLDNAAGKEKSNGAPAAPTTR